MDATPHFNDIHTEIIRQIQNARSSINIAVAWLTDSEILQELACKAKEGLVVQLLVVDDEINSSRQLLYDSLRESGGEVYFIPSTTDGAIMHHKFCIIDSRVVITGSYNWSFRARTNDENIIVLANDNDIIGKYKEQFKNIKRRMGEDVGLTSEQIIQRMISIKLLLHQVLKNFRHNTTIIESLRKLDGPKLPDEVQELLLEIEKNDVEEILQKVELLITRDKKYWSHLLTYGHGYPALVKKTKKGIIIRSPNTDKLGFVALDPSGLDLQIGMALPLEITDAPVIDKATGEPLKNLYWAQ